MELEQSKDRGRSVLRYVRQNPGELLAYAVAAAMTLAMIAEIARMDTPEFREEVEKEQKRYCLVRGIEDAEKCKEYRIREDIAIQMFVDKGW